MAEAGAEAQARATHTQRRREQWPETAEKNARC
jgi:hypothetical protein